MSGASKTAMERLEQRLCARFEAVVPKRVNGDSHFVWRGRCLTADCLLQIGSVPYLLRFEQGTIKECRRGLPMMCSWDFAVRGSARAWEELWQDPPKAGWHDIGALIKRGEMTMEGRLHPLIANLQYFKDMMELPRKGGSK